METRMRRRGDDDVVVNAGSAAPDTAGNKTSAHSQSPVTRKRTIKNQRVKTGDIDSDVESDDEDKCNHEMLQKRLKSVTDEKEIKRLKRLLRNRVSAQQARERKKRYINDLEQQLQDKESELSAVKTKMQDVTSDNMTLRRLITTMRGANTLPAHPANSSCMPGQAPPASPNRTRRVSNTYVEEDQQAHKWHVSEVPQDE